MVRLCFSLLLFLLFACHGVNPKVATPTSHCGNALVELGEECDGGVRCDSKCRLLPDATNNTRETVAAEEPVKLFQIPLGKAPRLGSANAPVSIVVFSDFQCPFCARAELTLAELRQIYGDKIAFYWRDLPLTNIHPNAEPAAIAAHAAGRQGNEFFWAFHDALFARQSEFSRMPLSPEQFAFVAESIPNLRLEQWRKDLESISIQQGLYRDGSLAAKFDIQGTPAFFVNGERLSGAQPLQKFQAVIDRQLARAEALLARGVAPSELYKTLIQDAKQNGEQEQTPRLDSLARYQIDESNNPLVFGAKEPLVTLSVFSDFQCPYCKRLAQTLEKAMAEYPSEVRVAFHNFPLQSMHPDAFRAALTALEAARQEQFQKVHDKLFANQDDLSEGAIVSYFNELGLDSVALQTALESQNAAEAVEKDIALARSLAIKGTPTMFVNGKPVRGAVSFERLQPLLEKEIARAELLLAQGTKPADLYQTIVKDGLREAVLFPSEPQFADPEARHNVTVGVKEPSWGPSDATLTLVYFADFASVDTLSQQGTAFGSTLESKDSKPTKAAPDTSLLTALLVAYPKELRVVYKPFPTLSDEQSMNAAKALLAAAAQGGFVKFWREIAMFASAPSDLESLAKNAKLKLAAFQKAMQAEDTQKAVRAAYRQGLLLGVTEAPTLFLNGKRLRGSLTFENLQAALEAERLVVKELLAKKVKPNDVYKTLTEKGEKTQMFLPSTPIEF